MIGLFLLFVSLVLVPIKIDLDGKLLFQETILIQKEKQFKASEIENLEKEVASLNKVLLELNSVYKDKLYFTSVLKTISEQIPEGLYLTNLSYKRDTASIDISGFSPDRNTLTKFKENLEREPNFAEVFFPPSNWVEPLNINFLASFKIK